MCVDHSTQLGVVCKPAEGALNSIVDVIDKGVKEHQSLYWTPLVTSVSCLPFLHLGMESSCALGKASLKICQLCSSTLSLRTDSWGVLLTNSEELEMGFPKIKIPDFTFACPVSLQSVNSTIAWSLQPRAATWVLHSHRSPLKSTEICNADEASKEATQTIYLPLLTLTPSFTVL